MLAEIDQVLRTERTVAGWEVAKREGRTGGRKPGLNDLAKKKAEQAKKSSSNKRGSGSGSSKTNGSTVYWTPGGAVYHRTPNCPTLSRSRTIYHGSISSCPKNRGCKVCF